MKINVANTETLGRLLRRKKRDADAIYEVDPGVIFREILTWANRLVPSESGSILLDDPLLKQEPHGLDRLYFAACFGKRSSSLVGTCLSHGTGIAGETYRSGKSYISRDVRRDRNFFPRIDEKTGFETLSVICAPVAIRSSPIGVIEMINRKGTRIHYDGQDLALLEIFAGYTATLIHNALISRSFEELSKRDNLTDLYNDRYFFYSLERAVRKAIRTGGEISMIFFDLDRFKEVNDTHGHLAGSAVLAEVADLLRQIFPATALMSRYGGDEYVVVIPGHSVEEAAVFAEHIRTHISDNTFLRRRSARVRRALNIEGVITCSVGVSSLSRVAKKGRQVRQLAEALIKSADSAMYEAKKRGKNRVCIAGGPPRNRMFDNLDA